jgi:hypothetical protein
VGGSVRTAPDASYFSLRRTLRGSVTNERARAVGSVPTTNRRLLLPHAPRPRARGTPGGGHGAARSRCAARPRNGRRTETAADPRRTRQAMDRCTAHASAYNAYNAYNNYNAYNAYNAYNPYHAYNAVPAGPLGAPRAADRAARDSTCSPRARVAAQKHSGGSAD